MYNFEKFFEIGEELSKINDESHIRSAINRDYYALFNETRKYLVEIRGKTNLATKNGIHAKVCNTLKFSNGPTENYIGDILDKLKKIRGYTDYDWKEKNVNYFKKMLVQAQKDVPGGLESLKYLTKKYGN